MILLTLFLILVCALADYGRGSGYKGVPYFKQLCIVVNGYCLAVLSGHPFDFLTLTYIFGFWAFIVVGYGQPWGAALHGRTPEEQINSEIERYFNGTKINKPQYEKWQLHYFKTKSAYYDLAIRGALSLPFILIGAWQIVVAYTVAFPLSAYIAFKLTKDNKPNKYGEGYRGLIGATITRVL